MKFSIFPDFKAKNWKIQVFSLIFHNVLLSFGVKDFEENREELG